MLITLYVELSSTSVTDVQLTGVAPLELVSHRFNLNLILLLLLLLLLLLYLN